MRREIWLRLTPEYSIQMAILTVKDGKVLVDQTSLTALHEGRLTDVQDEVTWTITYELMREILDMRGFRFWEEVE